MPETTTTFSGPSPYKVTHEGDITANERWTLQYDPTGSDSSMQDGYEDQAFRVSMKFQPGGEGYEGSLVEVIGPNATPRSQPYTIVVPSSAAYVELWFKAPTAAEEDIQVGDEEGTYYRFDVTS